MAALGALGVAAIAASTVSTGLGVYSAVQSGAAQKDAAEFNAAVARNDAIAAQQQAASESRQLSRRNRLRAATRRARFAASGIELSGSAEDVMFDSAVQDELDRQNAIYRGELRARRSKAEAGLQEAMGRNAVTSSYLNAAGTFFGGVSQGLSIASNPSFRKKGGSSRGASSSGGSYVTPGVSQSQYWASP